MNAIEVLLVEDDLAEAELTIRGLRKHQLANNLVHVRDGEEALGLLLAIGKHAVPYENIISPKLILLDVKMPKMNGIEVLRHIKADVRTRGIPVVMLTSSNQDPDMHMCYDLGANSYVVKPVEFDKFAEAMYAVGLYWLLLNQLPI